MNIIFDFDGTLYSKKGFAFYVIMHNLFSLRYLLAERRTRKEFHGQYFGDEYEFYKHFFQRAAEISGLRGENFRKWYQEKYMPSFLKILKKHFRAHPIVNRLLQTCKEKNINLFVYSDYNNTEKRMEAIGINKEYFRAISDAPSFGGLKPCKLAFEKFMKENNISLEESVFVGDSDECDKALALSLGISYIPVSNDTLSVLEKHILNKFSKIDKE